MTGIDTLDITKLSPRHQRIFVHGVRGGDGSGDDGGGENTPDPTGEGENKDKTFTQEDLNKLLAKEKREGKSAGQRELLESLGIEDPDELKRMMAAARKAEEDKKSEDDKAREKLAADQRKAEEREQKAAQTELHARIKDALQDAGVDRKQATDLAAMIKVKVDADDDEIADEVKALADKFPQLFEEGDGSGGQGNGTPGSDPGRPGSNKGKPGPKTTVDQAKEILHQRHPELAAKAAGKS